MMLKEYENKLENCFEYYETIQAGHLDMLLTLDMPDLASMNQQRQAAFIDLKNSLNHFMENAGITGEMDRIPLLIRFEGRIESIIKTDDKISAEIKKHQTRLKNTLSHMKKGKVAMAGYRTAGMNPQRPHVLSMDR